MTGPHGGHGPFWASLTSADKAELIRIGTVRHFAAGTAIFHQEDRSDYVLVIRSGCVIVVAHTGDGFRAVLALRDAGDLLGEIASVDGGPRSATLYALTAVEAIAVAASRFAAFQRDRPHVTMALQRLLSGRLRESDRSRAEAGAATIAARLATLLLQLCERYGEPDGEGGVRVALPLTQADLAGLVMTSTRTVGRVLETWRENGWVTTSRLSIQIRDPMALADMGPIDF